MVGREDTGRARCMTVLTIDEQRPLVTLSVPRQHDIGA